MTDVNATEQNNNEKKKYVYISLLDDNKEIDQKMFEALKSSSKWINVTYMDGKHTKMKGHYMIEEGQLLNANPALKELGDPQNVKKEYDLKNCFYLKERGNNGDFVFKPVDATLKNTIGKNWTESLGKANTENYENFTKKAQEDAEAKKQAKIQEEKERQLYIRYPKDASEELKNEIKDAVHKSKVSFMAKQKVWTIDKNDLKTAHPLLAKAVIFNNFEDIFKKTETITEIDKSEIGSAYTEELGQKQLQEYNDKVARTNDKNIYVESNKRDSDFASRNFEYNEDYGVWVVPRDVIGDSMKVKDVIMHKTCYATLDDIDARVSMTYEDKKSLVKQQTYNNVQELKKERSHSR